MSHGAQAICWFVALVLFIVAAILAWVPKQWWATFIAAGLAAGALVFFWNALAAT
jgi:hypothetical protein